MGTRTRPRTNGSGGLWTIKRKRWNDAKQKFEMVELYVRGQELKDSSIPEGKRKWITGTGRTPEEAEKRLLKALVKRGYKKALEEAGKTPQRARGGLLTETYLNRWLSELDSGSISETQKLRYKQYLHNHVIPHIGHVPLRELGHKHLVELFGITLPSKRKVKGGLELDTPLLGNNGLLNVYKTLNRALRIGVAEGVIERNPMALVKPPKFEKPKENIPHYMHIIINMFKKMQKEGDPDLDHFFLAMLGLRKGERLGLAWNNVILRGENPTLIITQQLQRVTGKGLQIKPTTKSGQERRVSLVSPFIESMKRLKVERKRLEKLDTFKPEKAFRDLVFLNEYGKPIDPNTDNDMWNALLKRNKAQVKIRQHALRHVSATYLSDINVPESVVKSILGHESDSMFYFYARQTSKKNKSELERYGEHLEKALK